MNLTTKIKIFFELIKFRVVSLLIFTAWVGMLLSLLTEQTQPNMLLMLNATIGIFLAASASACFNQLFERKLDAKMLRTKARPLPQKNISPRVVLYLALLLTTLSIIVLYFFVNTLTLSIALFSIIFYSFIYTLYLKKHTTQNIVIGGLAGALPPLLGWTAMSGTIHPLALQLVIIIFVWTPSHFWALAIAKKNEYEKTGLPMLPVAYGNTFAKKYVLFYSILLFVVSILPWVSTEAGLIYLSVAILLGGRYLQLAIILMKKSSNYEADALKLFWWSIQYLIYLFAFLFVDKAYYLLG